LRQRAAPCPCSCDQGHSGDPITIRPRLSLPPKTASLVRRCGDAARSWPTPLGSDQTNTAATSSPYGRELGLRGLVGYRATTPVRQKREPEQSAKRPQHRKPLNAERLIIATVWIWIRNDQLETIQGHIRAFRFGSRLKIAYLLDKQTFTPKHLLPNDGTLS
jgi:hypothetical protein